MQIKMLQVLRIENTDCVLLEQIKEKPIEESQMATSYDESKSNIFTGAILELPMVNIKKSPRARPTFNDDDFDHDDNSNADSYWKFDGNLSDGSEMKVPL